METKPIMKRVFVVTLLSFAATGCAQSRSALSKQDSPAQAPVAATSVPPLSDTINRGMGSPAVVKTAIKDPDSSQWAGVAPVTAAKAPSAGSRPAPGQPPPKFATTAGGPAAFGPLAARAGIRGTVASGQPAQPVAAMTTPPTQIAANSCFDRHAARGGQAWPSRRQPNPGRWLRPLPDSRVRRWQRVLVHSPALTDRTRGNQRRAAHHRVDPGTAGSGGRKARILGRAGPETIDPAPASTSALAQPAPLPASSRQAKRPAADPLLGPEPDLMPPIPDVPPVNPRTAPQSASPASKAASSAPPKQDVSQPAVNPQVSSPSQPPADVKPRTALLPTFLTCPTGLRPPWDRHRHKRPHQRPHPLSFRSSSLLRLPTPPQPPRPLTQRPRVPAIPPPSPYTGPRPAAVGSGSRLLEEAPEPPSSVSSLPPRNSNRNLRERRSAIKPSSAAVARNPRIPRKTPPQILSIRLKNGAAWPSSASAPIVKVGDEVITFYDLTVATREQLRQNPELKEAYKDPSSRAEALKHITMLRRNVLNALIDQSLLVQDAKRPPDKQERYENARPALRRGRSHLSEKAKFFPLQKKYGLANEYQVKEKLAEQGRSLTEMQQNFRQMFLAQNYLHSRLGAKVKVELPELAQIL